MKRIIFTITVALISVFNISGQELSTIQLKSPDKTRGKATMKALNDRQSVREFSNEMLKDQDLSDILWAANGINRTDGKRTAPSAMNKQDVDIYVIMKEGAYLYDARAHALKPVAKGDHRASVAGNQDFVKEAPVCLLLVSETARFGDNVTDHTRLMAAADVGIVCQNINIACSALGLNTVPRGWMDQEALKKILNLTDTQLLLLNNPVGYPKK